MSNSNIIEKLKKMKFTAMAEGLTVQIEDSAYSQLGFEDRLGLLVVNIARLSSVPNTNQQVGILGLIQMKRKIAR